MTPGHTLGTVSLLFNTHQGSKVHRTLLWGGTAFNFGRQPNRMERLQAYIDATARVRDVARTQNVDVFISNHSGYDQAVEKLARVQQAGHSGHPARRRALGRWRLDFGLALLGCGGAQGRWGQTVLKKGFRPGSPQLWVLKGGVNCFRQ